MSPLEVKERVNALVDCVLSDSLTDAQRAELEALLLADDDALAAYAERCQLETALHFEVRSAAAARRVDAALAGLRPAHVPPSIESAASELASGELGATPTRGRFHGWAPWMIAASLLVATGVWLSSRGMVISAERQPQPVARLEASNAAVWLGDEYKLGHRFLEGDSVYLATGSARLSMTSGAEIELRGPCFVSLDRAMRVRLEEGSLTAQVAEWAHGFTVDTDTLSVVDLGTKFAVATDSDGAAEAHVLDGRVRVQPTDVPVDSRQSILLSKGEALRIQEKSKVATKLSADRDRFDAVLDDVAPFKPVPLFNTGRGLSPGDEDPHWRVVAGPQCAAYHEPCFAVVCNADYRYLSNDPGHSQWVSLVNPVRPGLPSNVEFTFQTEFDLTGYDLASVAISAQVIADNGVRAVRINGSPVPLEAWSLNKRAQVFNRFYIVEISDGFVPGKNVIEFDVWNGVDQIEKVELNPMAIRVEWSGYGRLKGDAGVASAAPADGSQQPL